MATYPPLLSRFGIAFLTVFLVCDSVFAQPNKKILEQTSFGAEGSVERPVKLPRSVIELLLEVDNGQLKSCLKEEPDISTHFEASRININVDAYPDLIVKATSLCFRGARRGRRHRFRDRSGSHREQDDWHGGRQTAADGPHGAIQSCRGDRRPVSRGVDRLCRSVGARPVNLHDVHLRRRARRVRHSRRLTRGRDRCAGDRSAADGESRRHRAPVARRRRARQLFARRQRQDRDAHLQRAHRGRVAAGRQRSLAGDRCRLSTGRRDQASR